MDSPHSIGVGGNVKPLILAGHTQDLKMVVVAACLGLSMK